MGWPRATPPAEIHPTEILQGRYPPMSASPPHPHGAWRPGRTATCDCDCGFPARTSPAGTRGLATAASSRGRRRPRSGPPTRPRKARTGGAGRTHGAHAAHAAPVRPGGGREGAEPLAATVASGNVAPQTRAWPSTAPCCPDLSKDAMSPSRVRHPQHQPFAAVSSQNFDYDLQLSHHHHHGVYLWPPQWRKHTTVSAPRARPTQSQCCREGPRELGSDPSAKCSA